METLQKLHALSEPVPDQQKLDRPQYESSWDGDENSPGHLRMESLLSQPLVEHDQAAVGKHEQATFQLLGVEGHDATATISCGTGCGFSKLGCRVKDARARSAATRKLSVAIVLCLMFIAVEVTGGLIANSLAIFTDAAHLLSDVTGFAISLFAIWAASWKATPRQTYGFFRIEILGALLSIQLIWLLTGILVFKAIDRILHHNKPVDGRVMFAVACLGLCFNLIMIYLLGHHGHKHDHHEDTPHHDHELVNQDIEMGRLQHECLKHSNINIQGAYLHVLGDLIQSIGVMIGGAVIWAQPSWRVIDLVCTLFFSVLVLGTTIKILRDIVEVLMESTPREIDATSLEKGLLAIPGVIAIHELHIWAITVGKTSLACHVKIDSDADADVMLQKVVDFCEQGFNISHVTIQIERNH